MGEAEGWRDERWVRLDDAAGWKTSKVGGRWQWRSRWVIGKECQVEHRSIRRCVAGVGVRGWGGGLSDALLPSSPSDAPRDPLMSRLIRSKLVTAAR